MASYFSYLSSNPSTQYPQQQPPHSTNQTPASSTWGGAFSSRFSTLRKALTRDNEEDDPENEDASHVSNVLRAYYLEKGRIFPEWLPPDPRRPVAAPPHTSQHGQYGVPPGNNMAHTRGSSGGRGGLSDLWDSGPSPSAPPPAQSLRVQRPTPQSLRSHEVGVRPNSSDPSISYSGNGARPLPSQRVGSYQTTSGANPAPANATVVGSRDRLRARLQGGGSGRNSPALPGSQPSYSDAGYGRNSGGSVNSNASHMQAAQPWNAGNQYDSNASYGSTSYRQ